MRDSVNRPLVPGATQTYAGGAGCQPKTFEQVLAASPSLCWHGLRAGLLPDVSFEESRRLLITERRVVEDMARKLSLLDLETIRRPQFLWGAGVMKHQVQGSLGYCTHGQFIAAMLMLGFEATPVGGCSEVHFNVRASSWRSALARLAADWARAA